MGIAIKDIIQTSELGKLYTHTLSLCTSISATVTLFWFFPNDFISIPIKQATPFETLLEGIEDEVRFIPGLLIEEFVGIYFSKARNQLHVLNTRLFSNATQAQVDCSTYGNVGKE